MSGDATPKPDFEGFAKAILEQWPTSDIDGADLFELSVSYGMISEVPGGYDPEHHIDAEGICPERGDPWYEYTFRGEAGPGLYSRQHLTARIAELEAEKAEAYRRRDEWRKKAEGYDAVRLALREKVGDPWPPHMSRVLWAGIAADQKKRADDAEAELAALREARSVRVKPLEWVSDTLDGTGFWANGEFAYQIRPGGQGYYRWRRGLSCTWVIPDQIGVETAKAAAQDDYERRILAALEPAPVTVGEAWQPIETAPKDGLIDIWLTDGVRWADCYYDRICGEWRTSRPSGKLLRIREQHVSHWMPRPAPPRALADSEEAG